MTPREHWLLVAYVQRAVDEYLHVHGWRRSRARPGAWWDHRSERAITPRAALMVEADRHDSTAGFIPGPRLSDLYREAVSA